MDVTQSRRSRWTVIAAALAVFAAAAAARATSAQQAPAAPPGARTAAQPQDPPKEPAEAAAMRKALAELDDDDASVREQGRVRLMGMRREHLPTFQKIVRENLPLTPSQAAVLRPIVQHVYLSGETYDTTGTEGFLGVKMHETAVRLPGANPAEQYAPAYGVVIVERMPGWVGARMLQDGDVILGVVERPEVRMMSMQDFQVVVRQVSPGTTIHFQVLRQGQVIRVPIAPDPRPWEIDTGGQQLIFQRQQKADDYWNSSFGPMLKEGVG